VKKTSFANDATLVARNTGIQIPESWKFLPHYFIKTKKLITSSERDSRTTSEVVLSYQTTIHSVKIIMLFGHLITVPLSKKNLTIVQNFIILVPLMALAGIVSMSSLP
jgi:hypothetical protein